MSPNTTAARSKLLGVVELAPAVASLSVPNTHRGSQRRPNAQPDRQPAEPTDTFRGFHLSSFPGRTPDERGSLYLGHENAPATVHPACRA
jgi:hypothetical protein